jgi:hypothetical protein
MADVIHLPLARANLIEALDGEDYAFLALAGPAIEKARAETRRELDLLDCYLTARAALAYLANEGERSVNVTRAANMIALALAGLESVIEREAE